MSVQDKFRIGDKVILADQGYAEVFFPNYKGGELIIVNIEEAGHSDDLLVTDGGISAFDFRFELSSRLNGGENTYNSVENSPSNDDKCEGATTQCGEENEWYKKGKLPPVGTVCEAGIPHVSGVNDEVRRVLWIEGYPIAHFECGEKTYTWFSSEGGFYPPGVFEFRPIRTPEEIAKQEREAYCDRIYSVLCKAERKNNRSDMAEALYDAGLRFVEEE